MIFLKLGLAHMTSAGRTGRQGSFQRTQMSRVHPGVASPPEETPSSFTLEETPSSFTPEESGRTGRLTRALQSTARVTCKSSASSRTSRESSEPDEHSHPGIRRSTTAQLANAVDNFRHGADNKAKEQLAIEGEHEEMVSRLKIRLSSA